MEEEEEEDLLGLKGEIALWEMFASLCVGVVWGCSGADLFMFVIHS